MTHVVVVGAGIAGLAAAHAVAAANVDVDVTVVDGAQQVGGKLRTSSVAGLDVDEGAESFLVRVPEALDLARAVGLGGDVVHPATTSASVWARGMLRPLPPRTLLGVPSSVGSLRGVLSASEAARVALDAVWPRTPVGDDVAVGALVARRMGRAVVDRLVDPLLGGVYAGRAHDLSVRATMPQLDVRQRSLMAAVRAATPATSSAVPVFGSVRGGMGRLAAATAGATGASFVMGRLVRRIERTSGGFRVVHGPTIDEQALDADAVVVAVPASAAARLLTDVAATAAAELASIDYASVALVTTAWRRSDTRPMHGSGYLVPPASGHPVKAVTFSSAKWAHLDAGDVVVARCSFGRYGESRDLQRDGEELVRLAAHELRSTVGFAGDPVAARVTRWGGGLPQYTVGHVDRVRRIRAAVAAVPGLAVCGAAYDGVGIPACIRTGREAAAQILEGLRAVSASRDLG